MNFTISIYYVAIACCWIVISAIALRVPARAKGAMDRIDQVQAKIDRLRENTETATELTQKPFRENIGNRFG